MKTLVSTRVVAAALICILGVSSTARADQPSASSHAEEQKRIGMYKIIAGAGIALVGLGLVAASHQSATVTSPGLGTISASSTNTGGMIAGIGMMGGGGFLIYLGAKDRQEADKSPSLTFAVGHRKGLFVTKQW